ncbi:hypothetical protein [Haloferula sp.]|uniref:hypothetical protein n=1 Tax=Haloferula sp. TaxID=2497595 RepID=UPI00329E24A2
MNPILHSFKILWTRYRWEILAFALVVILSGITPALSARQEFSPTLAVLESLGLFWLTLRLLLSEDGFKTQGGWQARPIMPSHVLTAQLLMLGLVTILPLAWHTLLVHSLFQPNGDQWKLIFGEGFWSAALGWLAFCICIKLFTVLLLRRLEGAARKATWSVFIIALVPVIFLILPETALQLKGSGGGSGRAPGDLSTGIQNQLPKTTEFIGNWNRPEPRLVSQARLGASIPFDSSNLSPQPGFRIVESSHAPDGMRTSIRVIIEYFNNDSFAAADKHPIPVLIYDNGMAATCLRHMRRNFNTGSCYLPVQGFEFSGSFYSPASLPENRNSDPGRFKPTHLLFFHPDSEKPEIAAPLERQNDSEKYFNPPKFIPDPSKEEAFNLAVRQLIDSSQSREEPLHPDLIPTLFESLPKEAIEPILAYRPWPEQKWKELLLPFLKKHLRPQDKSIILKRLTHDPRLTEICLEKGWTEDAVLVLRQRAEQGLSLDLVSLELLAEQGDPELTDDLARLAVRLRKGIDGLAPKLRKSPDFDWSSFVANGWRSRKYADYQYRAEGWIYARWAAELGDPTALRRLAEKAASGKKWERHALAELIPSAPADLIPFLRENLSGLEYQSTTQTWEAR